ncbi:hypothetical protein HLB23_39730 [Nocardia uniformis]|uniref:Uncharacterized protein n=2 Tax=Nocardia uniformis TaxID=53432 RepID=A0A849CDJ7_9NOCA|nr:hypothetical protein [Nocardia uniformis]
MVGEETFLWSLRHRHHGESGAYRDCCEVLGIRRDGGGRLTIVFSDGPGRLVPDGFMPTGFVGTTEGGVLNLHEPGTVRALLDEARSRGWQPEETSAREMDGWTLFDAVARSRNVVPPS